MVYLGGQRGNFQKLSLGSETLHITSEGSGEMFEGDFAKNWENMKHENKCKCQSKWCNEVYNVCFSWFWSFLVLFAHIFKNGLENQKIDPNQIICFWNPEIERKQPLSKKIWSKVIWGCERSLEVTFQYEDNPYVWYVLETWDQLEVEFNEIWFNYISKITWFPYP